MEMQLEPYKVSSNRYRVQLPLNEQLHISRTVPDALSFALDVSIMLVIPPVEIATSFRVAQTSSQRPGPRRREGNRNDVLK